MESATEGLSVYPLCGIFYFPWYVVVVRPSFPMMTITSLMMMMMMA